MVIYDRYEITYTMIDRHGTEITRLTRHLHVLQLVIDQEPIGLVRLATETNYPQHQVRHSLHVLERASLIAPSSRGVITTAQTSAFIDDLDNRIDRVIDQVDSPRL